MREFKIRIWDVKDNDWYYTVPGKPEDHNVLDTYYFESVYQSEKDYIWEQYTGLKDKNGREIYEGDIVLHDKIMLADTDGFYGEEKNVPCVVEWDSIRTGYYPFNHYDTEWGRYTNGSDVEVIGNIHENKEVLNVQ